MFLEVMEKCGGSRRTGMGTLGTEFTLCRQAPSLQQWEVLGKGAGLSFTAPVRFPGCAQEERTLR